MREISPQEYESSLAEIEFFKDQLATKDAEIERLQAKLDGLKDIAEGI